MSAPPSVAQSFQELMFSDAFTSSYIALTNLLLLTEGMLQRVALASGLRKEQV